MRILKTTLTIFLCAIGASIYSQSVKNKSAKFDELIFPEMPVSGVQSLKVTIFPGSGLALEQNDLFEKKGLGKKLQAKQDQINGIGPNYVTFQNFQLAESGQDANIEIAFGEFRQMDKKLRDHNIVCVRDDGKIDKEDIKECPGYYYEIPYELPVVVKISDKNGSILNIDHFETQGVATFGYDASGFTGYISTSQLDAAFGKPEASKSILRNAIKDRLILAGDMIQRSFFFQEVKVKINITSGGGKLNYDDLDEAQEMAIAALENIQDPSSSDAIGKAIEIWNTALEEVDMNNKKARINRKVAGFVALNKAKGYYYLYDYENAKASCEEAAKFLKFSTNLAHMESVDNWKYKISESNKNGSAIEANKSMVNGTKVKAPELIRLVKVKEKDALYSFIQPGDKYTLFMEDFNSNSGVAVASGKRNESDLSTALLDGIAGLSNASWEDRVQHAPNMGYYISIAYSNKEAVPAEICDIESLNTLLANNSKISSVPNEIGQLKNLVTLNLASNNLTQLPDEIGQLENLKKLNLSKNQIKALPASLANCKNLKSLMIKGNSIPQSEIDQIQAALPKCKIKM